MAQISLYVENDMMSALREHSQRDGVSVSKYVHRIIDNYENGQANGWPVGYWDSVYGCLSDEDACALYAALDTSAQDCSIDESLDDACNWAVG